MRQKTQTDGTRPPLCHADPGDSYAARASRLAWEGQAQAARVAEAATSASERPRSAASHDTTRSVASRSARSGMLPAGAHNLLRHGRSNVVGAAFETRALEFLQRQRLRFVARNVSCRGGEIDLVMRERDGSLVFVEVRARAQRQYGGAAASVGRHKKQRLVHAARYYLASRASGASGDCACRFDVIAFEGGRLVWLRDAFRADEV